MNIQLKNNIQDFFSKQPVIIEGIGPKTWNMEGLSISLKTDNMKYFVLLVSGKSKYDWIIHFENESDTSYTDEEKEILFTAVREIVQPGEVITTEGGVTPGGIHALRKLLAHGFSEIDTNSGKNVYWASSRLLNETKFNLWIQHADPDDYKVINKKEPLSIDNTKPVVLVIQRNELTDEEKGDDLF